MIFSNKKDLHDHIIEYLLKNPGTTPEIVTYIHSLQLSPTIQGVYKALRQLLAADIIVKQKHTYLLSNVWKNKVSQKFSNERRFELSAGEQVSYRFTKLDHLDMFWKHSMQDIQETYATTPVFHALPHNFWYSIPGRRASEEDYYDNFKQQQVHAFTVIGGKTLLDINLKKIYQHEFHQYQLQSTYPFNRRDHMSIIGPYIITTRVSSSLARAVDYAYSVAKTEAELSEILAPKFAKPGPTVMTVENNNEKSKKLRKRIAKDFYIPRELRERFELF